MGAVSRGIFEVTVRPLGQWSGDEIGNAAKQPEPGACGAHV